MVGTTGLIVNNLRVGANMRSKKWRKQQKRNHTREVQAGELIWVFWNVMAGSVDLLVNHLHAGAKMS